MSKEKGNDSHMSTFSLSVMLQGMSNCAKDQFTNQPQTSESPGCLNSETLKKQTNKNNFFFF